jgi:hypothetical protein
MLSCGVRRDGGDGETGHRDLFRLDAVVEYFIEYLVYFQWSEVDLLRVRFRALPQSG